METVITRGHIIMTHQEYQEGLRYLKYRIQETRAHLADNEREITRLTEEERPRFEFELQRYNDRLTDFTAAHCELKD